MATEEEKRLHRCCFSGQRPEKLTEDEASVKAWLREQIDAAISSGYTTFISGCAMGVDIWAGQIVLSIRDEEKKRTGSSALHLITATPWPGFASRWASDWQGQYNDLLKNADLVVNVCQNYHDGVFQARNEWMVDHSSRLIAYFNGAPGGTRNTVEYAEKKGIEIVRNHPVPKPDPLRMDYPENLLRDIGLELIYPDGVYHELTEDQLHGLNWTIRMLRKPERQVLQQFYADKQTMEIIGHSLGHTTPWVQMHGNRGVRHLRAEPHISYIKDGYEKTELSLKLFAAEEMRKLLRTQKRRHPLMNEEDIVKFVFQGMLGIGHLISDPAAAMERLKTEYDGVDGSDDEPLTEKISPEWLRLNLRPAKAKGITAEDIANWMYESSCIQPLSFTRQNVCNFCVKAYPTEAMNKVAEKILNKSYLPSHSEEYRDAYKPAYRVLYRDYKKFKRMEV